MATIKRLEQIILTRKRVCSKCGKTMVRGDAPVNFCPICGKQLNRRAQPGNEPLTMEQLREMDGEPVWIVSGEGAVCAYSGWAIVGRYYDDTVALYVPDNVYYEAAIRHGTVIAYRRPPERPPLESMSASPD